MSTSAAAKQMSRSAELEAIINVRGRAAPTTAQKEAVVAKDNRFANIQTNAFFQAIFSENMSPEQKQAQVTKLLTFAGTREQNRENVKAFDLFKEYLQSEREVMATKIIKMSDTKNFALLRDTFDEINTALITFENDMRPLTEILDALHELRQDNQTMDAFREIKDEEKRAEAVKARDAEIAAEIARVQAKVAELEAENFRESQNKAMFGFGGIKPESMQRIAANQVALANSEKELATIAEKAAANKVASSESKVSNIDAKNKLKEMLNLGSADHQKRSENLIKSAVNFVETSKEKITNIRSHLGHMGDQIQNLDDANGQMTFIYAILGDGAKEAEQENKRIREETLTPAENENMVAKLTREGKQREITEHMTMLDVSHADITATVADLTTASIRIKNMNDANQTQVHQVSDLHARGVAGIADRLSTVIQAVGAAAITEANAMTADTLNTMSRNTDTIAMKESMRIAMGVDDRNEAAVRAIENLTKYGEVNKAAMEFTREGMIALRSNLDLMEEAAREVAQSVLDSKSVVADIVAGDSGKAKKEETTVTTKNPFGLGN